jgi:hypothetical protein
MIIQNVTQATFDKLRATLLSTHQADIIGTSQGTISGHGVVASYKFDAANLTLEVDIIHHPFFIPVSAIEGQLQNAVTAAKGSA